MVHCRLDAFPVYVDYAGFLVNSLSARFRILYTGTNLHDLGITVPADGLAPLGARPSANTMMTIKFDLIFRKSFGY